jgi:biopolymer transport protein ExbD
MKPDCAIALCLLLTLGCDERPKPSPAATPAPNAATAVLPPAPEPARPPELAIDAVGVKVGYSRVLLDKPEGAERLQQELSAVKSQLNRAVEPIRVERVAQVSWVTRLLAGLAEHGVTKVTIKTETRKEFASELAFVPGTAAKEAPTCSVVGMVLEDRATAVWKLSGGVAIKRARGFAGPDLTMTGETLARFGKACKDSSLLFVSAAPGVEWGQVFDLAASAKALPEVRFEQFVVLPEPPTPGHKVAL